MRVCLFACFWRDSPRWARSSSLSRFLDHAQRRTRLGRTPLDDWSARRRDLYLTTNNTHTRQTSMPPVGFEPTISADERQKTHALDRAATGTGILCEHKTIFGATRWRSWLKHWATSRKVAGSIPDGVIGICNWHNPSDRTMALELTRPLTEMSTRNISRR